ncbi:DUF177 domain-containing protein [Rhodobacterales bacterium HKCCE4037]|nr:DUF177 domain-containing protein [Rhodobacterales bacterium HKCCE4037]
MSKTTLSLARLGRSAPTAFEVEPDAEARARLIEALDLRGLRKVRLTGEVTPEGKADWRLDATLGATAIQDCVVTLEPVTTRIDTPVTRRYVADLPAPTGEEMEMPEDDTVEPLPASLDLMAVLTEALALALPDYPRAEGVEMGQVLHAAPGITPMTDEDAKPLAGLAALRDKLAGGGEDDENKG